VSRAVSVVIASRNRPRAVRRCIERLAVQTYDQHVLEVVVVDDGSEVPYEGLREEFAGRLDVRLARRQRGGPGPARNTGVAAADGRLVLFTDDDCLPEADWVERLVLAHAMHPRAILGGRITHAMPENPYSTASQILASYLYAYFNRDPADCRFFTTNNLALGRDVFEELGGFDETIPVPTSEDRELCDRAVHLGHTLRYVPDAVVGHAHPLGPLSFWEQHFSYGRGAVYYRRRHESRGQGIVRTEPASFYMDMLRLPFRQGERGGRGVFLASLLALSQAAVAMGFFAEAWWYDANRRKEVEDPARGSLPEGGET